MTTRPLLAALALAALTPATAATFSITHLGTPADAQAAIAHAADIWGGILASPVTIKVRVLWFPLGSAALGVTFPNGRRDFPGAPLASTWYATALANSIAGLELNPGENDMDIYLNSGTNWYAGTDGQPSAGQHDLVTVALHELGHGLGFVGLSKKEAGVGSLGLVEMADFAPLSSSFPWPQLDTLPGVFDIFLADLQDGPLAQLLNPGAQLGDAMTGGQLYFNGPQVQAANGGQGARIYAPSTFALGSSCVHFNESTYPTGNANELMTPFSATGDANHWPGPLGLAVMQDIGWTLEPGVGVPERPMEAELTVWPVPATDLLHLRGAYAQQRAQVLIHDATGRLVLRLPWQETIPVGGLRPGTYTVRMADDPGRTRFIKQ